MPLQISEHELQAILKAVAAAGTGDAAGRWIQQNATKDIPVTDRAQFIETIEVELRSLHEGNIARYRLRPNEFTKWNNKNLI